MNHNRLAAHELLDLHELINKKNVCAAKAAVMSGMVSDPQLRNFLQQDMQTATQHAQQIQQLLSGTNGGRY
ncbi:MAG: spore coat protein [Bacillota bacterium]|jgi:similar to spore coat protein